VHLSIFISVINQLDAQNFCFTISLLVTEIKKQVHILPKHSHNCQNTHSYIHTLQNPHIPTPTHTHTHIYTHPHKHTPTHTYTPTHYKTHTYTHPKTTKQVKTTTVKDTHQIQVTILSGFPHFKVTLMCMVFCPQELQCNFRHECHLNSVQIAHKEIHCYAGDNTVLRNCKTYLKVSKTFSPVHVDMQLQFE